MTETAARPDGTAAVGAALDRNGGNGSGTQPGDAGGATRDGRARDAALPARAAERDAREAARRQTRVEEKRRREAATIESTIAEKEAELAALATTMNDPTFYQTHPAPQTLFSSYARLKREIETLYERLERVSA